MEKRDFLFSKAVVGGGVIRRGKARMHIFVGEEQKVEGV